MRHTPKEIDTLIWDYYLSDAVKPGLDAYITHRLLRILSRTMGCGKL